MTPLSSMWPNLAFTNKNGIFQWAFAHLTVTNNVQISNKNKAPHIFG